MIEGPPNNQEYEPNTAYDGETCISMGKKYVFRITDSGGDGMCCQDGKSGGFTMSVDGKVFVERFGRDEEWSKKSFLFHVGNLTETPLTTDRPTPKPNSKRPTPKPTVWEMPTMPDLLTPQPVESEVVTPAPSSSPEPEEGVAVSFIMMGDSKYLLVRL